MGKVQFQVDGLDSNTASIFNADAVFDGNVDANSISISGIDIFSIIPNGVSYANTQPSSPTVGQVWIDADSSITDYDLSTYQPRVDGVSDTEIGYLNGVASSIQSQLNTKQDVVLGVSSAEIGYLANVTSDIQTQISEKAPLASPTITTGSFVSASATVDPVTISTANNHGGAGFAGVMTLENSGVGVTNPKKHIRLNSTGGLEIVNSAYSDTIFFLADNGNLSELGTVNGATIGDTGWQSVTSFNNGFSGTSVAYRRINNIVYLRGRITGGTAGTGSFFLPEGYRPTTIDFVLPAQQYGTGNITYVTVQSGDGNIIPAANAAWLSGISFPVG